MDFPDDKALRGFRSKAQSRWAHATDQWWADEYEKNTNYQSIPDKVNEDINEGIDKWIEPLNEVHPFVGLWDKSIDTFQKVKTIKGFIEWSKYIFKLGKFFKKEFNQKLVNSFLGQYTTLLETLKKWKEKHNDKIPPEIKDGWESFIDDHGNPEDDVWAPMDKAANDVSSAEEKVQKMNKDAYEWGIKAGKSVSDDVSDWINFKLNPNKYLGTSFLKGILSGSKQTVSNDDTIELSVNENALIRKASKQTGFDTEIMEKFWEDSIKEESVNYGEERKGKKFWTNVVEKFKKKIRHIDVLEARRIMNDRRELRKTIDKFVSQVASGNYAEAQNVVPEMIKKQLGTMINRKKEAYLKELGKQVKERAKEA